MKIFILKQIIFYPPPTIETISKISPSLSFTSPHFIELIIKHKSQGGSIIFTSHKKYKNKNFILVDLNLWKPNKKLKVNSKIWENL